MPTCKCTGCTGNLISRSMHHLTFLPIMHSGAHIPRSPIYQCRRIMTLVRCGRRISSEVLLYYTAHSAMPFLISRASDNVESRKRPNGTSPEYPTSSRSCRRLPHRLSLHPNRGPVLKVSTLGIWAFEAFWSLFPKVGKTGQYYCYIHRLFP